MYNRRVLIALKGGWFRRCSYCVRGDDGIHCIVCWRLSWIVRDS